MDKIIAAVIGGFVGALSAYIFNYFHWKTVSHKESVDSLCKFIIDTIDKLEPKCISYWLADGDQSVKDKKALEIEIKTSCQVVDKLNNILCSKVADSQPSSKVFKLRSLTEQLFDYATGGDFESLNKKPNPTKAAKISSLCSKARVEISSIRHTSNK